ncbi:hypothetical protein BH11PAT2_BH11PAT2_07170 [soil metagenome]
MFPNELDQDLFADDEQDPIVNTQSAKLITWLKYLLIAALFVVPVLALLKPYFTHPATPPALTPSNGLQVQTANFEALHKSGCTGDFCAGSI